MFQKLTPTLATDSYALWSVSIPRAARRPHQPKCLTDPRSDKVNLSIGLYYNEDGIIPQPQAVAEAEARLNAQPHGASLYLPMEGLNSYRHAIAPLLPVCLDHPVLQQQRVATIQTDYSKNGGGSPANGALKVGADFPETLLPGIRRLGQRSFTSGKPRSNIRRGWMDSSSTSRSPLDLWPRFNDLYAEKRTIIAFKRLNLTGAISLMIS